MQLGFLQVICCRHEGCQSGSSQESFLAWTRQYNKVYDLSEFSTRFQIYSNNLDFINKWNRDNLYHQVGMNQFGDLTVEEFVSLYAMRKPLDLNEVKKSNNLHDFVYDPSMPMNDTVDWRTKNAVTHVKNQGTCGSCYIFASIGAMEALHSMKTGQLVGLSEQNALDCCGPEKCRGCDGGGADWVYDYVIKNKGIDTEATYPYEFKENTCRFNAHNVGATITGYVDVACCGISETKLQQAVNLVPVAAAIDCGHSSFQFYKSGVYYEPACSPTALSHYILVVGYGNSGTTDYWIVKNSWSATWGTEGYILMSRNRNNNCGIASWPVYPTLS